MSSLSTHLDDLLAVLRASADLSPAALTPDRVRAELANQLDRLSPRLAERVRRLDDWHTETLSEFLTEAQLLAEVLDAPPAGGGSADTKVD
jgi:hypothetical protein